MASKKTTKGGKKNKFGRASLPDKAAKTNKPKRK